MEALDILYIEEAVVNEEKEMSINKKSIIKEKKDYPIMLDPIHVQEILRISRKKAYDFLGEVETRVVLKRKPEFHIKRVGRLLKIPKDSFFDWLEGK